MRTASISAMLLSTALTAQAQSVAQSRQVAVYNLTHTLAQYEPVQCQSRQISIFNLTHTLTQYSPTNATSRQYAITVTLDCNENGIPDVEEIASGLAEDCNGNGCPDECDFAFGISFDCNGNGIPDDCDISDSTSQDLNGNGVPDECEFIRGDANLDGQVDVADVIFGLDFLFHMGPGPCLAALDSNANGQLTISDAVYLVAALFTIGPTLPPPFPLCDADPEPAGLTCDDQGTCP